MATTNRFIAVIAAATCLFSWPNNVVGQSDLGWYAAEIGFLADLKSRVTGTPSHNKLIDHIECELYMLGLPVYSDYLNFTYNDQPLSPPRLSIGDEEVTVSAYAPYSGNTGLDGIEGELVDLTGPHEPPEWELASGKIAVVNITNNPADWRLSLHVWPGQPEWYIQTGVPTTTADTKIANLTNAGEAGVKGVVYAWENITPGNLYGQYTPFKRLYQGCPTVYVAGDASKAAIEGAKKNARAHLTLSGELIPNTTTRTIYTIVEGTKFKNESIILNTHTDGTNTVEENGHIALLAKAKHLLANPPERTTILVFVTGHMHQPAFSTTGRATSRWINDNPQYWRGEDGEMKAVGSTCVEHLGAAQWVEDLSTNSYYSAGNLTDELLYANTPEMLALLEKFWNGAYPGFLRVNDPIKQGVQFGEGEPLTDIHVPNFSLITVPLYLTAEMPGDFDERRLVDLPALKRQVDSFLQIWDVMDKMPLGTFGVVPAMEE
ncbi:uncharacterized protein A1O9_12050 [Exophiala aquamarina CBS 119918]|uniref:Peptidase M28 domain-containing protein n=1 Tax=Exophiala aquamarina CBS 119918 TaxID=1182545 RepID=A0A072P8Z1_9EURO|nr:uncharacterized protein A1O9_12050 [Exophiala aquamarina CBS 119918]KEF52060.1 hypothetical protein A1O9_12050 [Exophiala aquamarina CBS 119918]